MTREELMIDLREYCEHVRDFHQALADKLGVSEFTGMHRAASIIEIRPTKIVRKL